MVVKQHFNSNTNHFNQSSAYLERPRLRKLLEHAMKYPLVTVYAGSGYGKTRAMYSFLQEYDAYTFWVQLSERDNVGTRLWESYAHTVSMSWPEVGARLLEIGFPEKDEAFTKFETMMRKATAAHKKHVVVYDDFHLLHNPAVLRFFERAVDGLPRNATVVLISRTIPEINITGMMMHERVFTISEEALCFTEDEIAEYFRQLRLRVTRQDLRNICDDTQGWAFAVNLIGRSLHKEQKYERYALEAMKANIFRLIEAEISQFVSKPLWRFLLRISLIDNLTASFIRTLSDDDALIRDMQLLNAYIRYDYSLGAYLIHHLFLDYLRQNQYVLTDEEKRETYQKAGVWCENNNYHADALAYYEKSGDYDAIMRIVYSLNVQVPQNTARYALEIFDRIPEDARNPLFPAMNLKLKMSIGLMEETSALAERYVREYEARPESPDRNRAIAEIYGVWATLRMIMCPYIDTYDFDRYFEKQRVYYDKSPYEAFGPATNQPVGAYALLLGSNRAGAPEEYIGALSRAIPHSSHVMKGNLYGLDDLARGEICFYRRKLNDAEQYLKQALDKARSKRQYDIQSRAQLYLMLTSLSSGNFSAANDMLQSIKELIDEKEYTIRYETYDIALGHYYLVLGQPEQIPDWLKADFSPYAHPAFLENFANRVKAQYRYTTQRYSELLAFLENARDSETVLFGRIVFKVLEALSLYHLKKKEKAISVLSEAYSLAEPNNIIIPFTQYSKDMRTLTSAAMKDGKCTIPKAWLVNINRRASAFARRRTHMVSEYMAANCIKASISLTERETVVLNDLSHGLSRTEIAASQNISVNTVKMVINIIYNKLGVTGLPDAIRVAVGLKMI